MCWNKDLTSDFYCTECGKKGIPITRKKGNNKEPGHLKKLFCLTCKKEVNHVEIRPYGNYLYANFLEEFELGRFYEGKRIPVANLASCSNVSCPYNKHGRCWNSNYSFKCKYRPEISKEELEEMYNG